MSTESGQTGSEFSVPPPHPAVMVGLATLVISVWAMALGGNIIWSIRRAGEGPREALESPAVAVLSRPARHGPGHVAEIVNTGESPVDVCVRPGKPARQKPDGEMDCSEYCTTVPPCSVLGVGWRQGMTWEPGDEVIVEIANSGQIRAMVR